MKRELKKLMCITLLGSTLLSTTNVFAYNYNFSNTYSDNQFGNETSVEVIPDTSAIENIRRNKDITNFPVSYGVFGGVFDTDPTSFYHQSLKDSELAKISEYTSIAPLSQDNTGQFLPNTSTMATSSSGDYNGTISVNYTNQTLNNHTSQSKIYDVENYSDGSFASLTISKIGVRNVVFDGTSNNSLAKGIGHFTETSKWDGNVALASHNRGSNAYFGDIHTLVNGDKIKYTTKQGTRTYEVYNVYRISETDMTPLSYSDDNILTLITCVRNESELRWCVKAREVK